MKILYMIGISSMIIIILHCSHLQNTIAVAGWLFALLFLLAIIHKEDKNQNNK